MVHTQSRYVLVFVGTLGVACGPGVLGSPPTTEAPTFVNSTGVAYLANEVIVQRAPTTDDEAFLRELERMDAVIVPEESSLASRFGFVRIRLPGRTNADEAINRLQRAGVTAAAERHYLAGVSAEPNDPDYGRLWGLTTIGAPNAWEQTTGDRTLVVGVIDTGVDLDHPDLAANLWRNPDEIPGNGVDDDGNGFVDDVHGYDFVNGDSDPDDDHGHGSHCAGTIGAVGNNGVGVAGVNWSVSLASLKVLGSNGSGSLWGLAEAILYAAEKRIPVLNASLGCDGCNVSYVRAALDTYEASGGLFVAAAGNSGKNNDASPHYPSSHTQDAVISVAATDSGDRLAGFSNYGAQSVDVAAPGVGILSTTPGGNYASFNGTSMAAPHVAGAVALYWAQHPNASAATVKERLLSTASPLSSLQGRVLTSARLDAASLLLSDNEPPPAPADLVARVGARSDVDLTWSAVDASDLAGYRVRWGTESGIHVSSLDVDGTVTSTRIMGLLEGQRYFFVVHAFDAQANESPASNEVSADPSDIAAPPAVVDLDAEPVPGPVVDAQVVAASGEYSSQYAARLAVDGSPDTAWISPRRAEAQEEFLVVALNTPGEVSEVELRAPTAFAEFFPVGFDIEVSANGADWTPVAGRRQLAVPEGWMSVRFAEAFASHVRIRVVETFEHRSGHFYTGLGEVRVRGPVLAADSLRVTFTAPGDDPGEGTALRYDLRVSTEPLTEANFDLATTVAAPTPRASGVPIDHVFSGLQPETTYFVALRSVDDAGNVSGLSNVAMATTMVVPPAAVTDLAAEEVGETVTLSFTAVGGDGLTGQAAEYDIRYDLNPITAATFGAATPVPDKPTPGTPGDRETVQVLGLAPGEYYYFALKVRDAGGHESALSNVVGALTEDGVDTRPPAMVNDLTVFLSQANVPAQTEIHADSGARASTPASHLLDGDTTSVWQAPVAARDDEAWVVLDLGAVIALSQVRLHPGLSGLQLAEFPVDVAIEGSVDAANWTSLASRTGLSAPAATWVTIALPVAHVRYLRVYVTERGLGDCRPDQPTCARPVTLSEVEVRALTPELDADITWVAPGDDGFLGVATTYDLRTSTEPLNESTFETATPIALPAPQPGGLLELHRLPMLAPEAVHYFGLRSVDNAGNVSPLSNIATVATPGVPPAPITDLSAAAVVADQVTLSWTATGDDGQRGTATAYDLRYARERITPQTWAQATAIAGVPAPGPAGSTETFRVPGLDPDSTYYFAVIAQDERGQRSVLSNVLRVDTPDGVAPGQITDLTVAAVDPNVTQRLASTLGPSSESYSFETDARHLLDGDTQTIWLSPARRSAEDEVLMFDFGAVADIGRLRLRSAPAFTDLFPRVFRLEVRTSNQAPWQTVLDEVDVRTGGGWEEWPVGTVSAAQARIVIAEGGVWNDEHFAALAEVEFHPPRAERLSVNLSWTATGDDDGVGTAHRYDLRQAEDEDITEANFGAAAVLSAPTPSPAGTLERHAVGDLMPDTRYCFAVRVEDEVPQAGPVSNSACIDMPSIPPDAVSDLIVTNAEANALTLRWTAPGAQADQGTATTYDLRMATSRITTETWPQATPVQGLPTPAAAGTVQTHRVTGLLGQTRYYFALVATNDRQQTSPLSNSAVGTTLDEVAPTVITDLTLLTDTNGSGRLLAQWTAPGDGETGTLAAYDLRVSPTPIDASNFGQAMQVSVASPSAPGQAEQARISGLAQEALYYAAIRTQDAAGNWSAMSNVAVERTRDEAPAQVTDLAVQGGADDTTLTLTWTAPGDNGNSGRATSYDVRFSTTYISSANFEQATAVPNTPIPDDAGQTESLPVQGLVRGTVYYFALKAVDDRGNVSAMSNWVSSQTSDSVPPNVITDLVASVETNAARVRLDWTAPGDDETSGLAQAYELRYSTNPITASNFAQAILPPSQPSPLQSGLSQTWIVTGLPNEALVYFAIRARDDAGNWSAPSNSPSARTLDVAPRRITDVRQTSQGPTSVTVAWTAPGDDGGFGTATRYDLRWSDAPIDDANFASAQAAPTPAPRAAGTLETVTISGLASDRAYYVAVRTVDDRDNWSTVSNTARVLTSDTRPPSGITDLTVATLTIPTSLTLSWSAPGDDGTSGVASRYEVRRSSAAITTEAAWSAATVVAGPPRPGASGAQEFFRVYQLTGETTYHFSVRAYDEDNNAGPLSNAAMGTTAPIAPARVEDLVATAGPNEVVLTWTAPGDDERTGTAQSYDVRYSTDPITDGTFEAANQWSNPPAPAAAGTQQTVTITGLDESTRYFFALKATDDAEATSRMSNVPSATTPDLTAPSAPGALAGAAPGRTDAPLQPSSVTASSFLSSAWTADQLIDGDLATSWASAGDTTVQAQTVIVDLGGSNRVDRVEIHPDLVYPELMPPDFVIEISGNASQWTEVAADAHLSVTDAGWLQYGFRPVDARYIRVRATDLASSFGSHYAIIAEVRVFGAAAETGRVQLTWVAPGDDGDTGTADRYELYSATQSFDANNLGAATLLANPPAPLAAGTLQSTIVDALEGEQRYWFGLRAVDEAGNVGELAGAVEATTSAVAPAPVNDLAAAATGPGSIELTWSAPGDDGLQGTATRYEIRYAPWSLTSRSFPLGTVIASPPTPLTAGGQHQQVVTGLDAGTRYRFALVAYDDANAVSYLSNVAQAVTAAAADITPPAAVSNLDVRAPSPGGNTIPATASAWSTQQSPGFEAAAAVDGQLDTAWSAVETVAATGAWLRVDLGGLYRVDRLRAHPSSTLTQLFPQGFTFRASPDGLSWTDVGTFANYSASAGVAAESTFPAELCRYVELRVTDLSPFDNGLFYAVVAELEVIEAAPPPGSALLTWTAPGDDGQTGQATTYDLRTGPCPYNHATATPLTTEAPASAGQPERVRVSGLSATDQCFGLVTLDEAGNASPVSNVASF